MIKKYSLLALQTAVNQCLKLDPDFAPRLKPLENKTLELLINPLNVRFFMQFKKQSIQLLDVCNDLPDASIHSSPLGLIRLSLLPASKARSLFHDNLRLYGDVSFGQEVKTLFDSLDIDWEGHLAQFTGDVIAHQMGSMLRSSWSFKKRCTEALRQNMSEYLQDELRLLPSAAELEDFFRDVDACVLRVERLQAKLLLESEGL